jgi:antitoxin (DNA-binding transcriptional repressor) of toxin-antitoxin stability system
MNVSVVDLRYRMKSVLRAIERGESVTVLYRGKEKALLIPACASGSVGSVLPSEHPACGMWATRNDLREPSAYVRTLRQPRVIAALAAPRLKKK